VATLDAPTAQQSRLLVLFPLFVLLWGNEKKLASERDDVNLPLLPFAFHFGVRKKTLPGSGKEQPQLRVSLNVFRCSGKALDKNWDHDRRERKSHGFPTSFL
jgi:hypothetical protein